jgi:poly-gamma-glutamate synthesis protein (capsule biosynthesis protein)
MPKIIYSLLALFFSLAAHAQDTTRLRLLFVGDIMQHDSNIAAAFTSSTNQYDYSSCFEYVAPIVKSADLAIGNLELTLAGKPFKGYPQFSAPDELAIELKRIGFDVLVTANNHSVDRGRKGIERTIKKLDSLEILHTGTFKDTSDRKLKYPLLLEKNGFRLSLLNYTYGTNGIPIPRPGMVNLIDTVQIKKDIVSAKQQLSDAIIVFFHWGDEYQSLPNKEQKRLTTLCFREGVKIVIGSHPHVLQPMEWRKQSDQFVVYSLGNFISGQRPRYRDGGAMVWLELEKVKNDSISSTSIQNATYELEWVQKTNDATKNFVMLPFRYFETDSTYLQDKLLRDAFNVFKNDSRMLLAKHNINVSERKSESDKDVSYYALHFGELSEKQFEEIQLNDKLKIYSLDRINIGVDRWNVFAGKFSTRESASVVLKQIQEDEKFKQTRIVKRVEAGM